MSDSRRHVASQRAAFLDRLASPNSTAEVGPSGIQTPAPSRAASVPNAGQSRPPSSWTTAAVPLRPRITNPPTTPAPSRPNPSIAVTAAASTSLYTCISCLDSFPSLPAATILSLSICQSCFDSSVRPLFQQHLIDETSSVIWSGQEISIEDVKEQFLEEFVREYRERMREYAVAPGERVYCGCGKFVGKKGEGRGRCQECGKEGCLRCGSVIEKGRRHVCSKSSAAGESSFATPNDGDEDDNPLAGAQRGKDYQKCPKCGLVVNLYDACNHITCPRGKCRTQFCYLCGKEAYSGSGHWSRPEKEGQGERCRMYGVPPAVQEDGAAVEGSKTSNKLKPPVLTTTPPATAATPAPRGRARDAGPTLPRFPQARATMPQAFQGWNGWPQAGFQGAFYPQNIIQQPNTSTAHQALGLQIPAQQRSSTQTDPRTQNDHAIAMNLHQQLNGNAQLFNPGGLGLYGSFSEQPFGRGQMGRRGRVPWYRRGKGGGGGGAGRRMVIRARMED